MKQRLLAVLVAGVLMIATAAPSIAAHGETPGEGQGCSALERIFGYECSYE